MSDRRGTCGTCRFFEVRNAMEADLARVARPESECAPGEWVFRGERRAGCHGGAVRGRCLRWQEVPLESPQVDSTFGCRLWQAGGPVVRGADAAKSTAELVGSANHQAPLVPGARGAWWALGAVAALAVASSFPRVLSRRRGPRWENLE